MTSTFSTSLRLELMTTGDQSGTWGDTTNINLGTLLEQAITGVLSVAEGDTTLTLTTVNGGSDQARNAVINLTGAMTAARNVVVQTPNKLYLIKNSTTGGFKVTVKTAAGTGVDVLAGTSRWLYSDGTNVVDGLVGTLASQAASAVSISGGTITGLTSLTLASGVASPATNDAAALGTSSLMWSDLFLASGGVINWNNGDVTITHSANLLAFAGASSGYTFDAAVYPSANDVAALGVSGTAWSDLFLASGGVINWNAGNVTLTHAAGLLTIAGGGLVLAAGTTSLAPLKMISGTNLTTAAAGAAEFDGKVFYDSAVASSRQVRVTEQFAVNGSVVSLSNSSTSAQNIFPSANDVLTLSASTAYSFDALVYVTKGTNSIDVQFGFGGTATFTSLLYFGLCATFTVGTISTNEQRRVVTSASATTLFSATAVTGAVMKITGTLRVNGGGTITPQITFASAAGGTCQIEPNAYFRIWPIGVNTVEAVGNWG